MSEQTMRDPRVEPRAGDVFKDEEGTVAKVVAVDGTKVVVETLGALAMLHRAYLPQYQVIHVAEG
jgi:hypothetical protein